MSVPCLDSTLVLFKQGTDGCVDFLYCNIVIFWCVIGRIIDYKPYILAVIKVGKASEAERIF